MSKKINSLLQAWPSGTVALLPWLATKGVSQSLASRYQKSGWIDSVGRGAFVRRGDKVGWEGAVHAIQTQAGRRVHPGGRTALQLFGHSHFLRLGARPAVFLYGASGQRLPKWLRARDWGVELRFSATALFAPSAEDTGLAEHVVGSFALRVSTPERAILEALDGMPRTLSFDEAALIMEGLTTLRPALLQPLLESCTSIKVKRTFLYLARVAGHAWYRRLQRGRVALGTGKRAIVRGGKLDAEFMITVPPERD